VRAEKEHINKMEVSEGGLCRQDATRPSVQGRSWQQVWLCCQPRRTLTREVVQQPETLLYDERVLLEEALQDEEEGDEQALVLDLPFTARLLREQVAETPQHWADEL